MNGAAGATVNLGANALTLNGSGNGTFGGTIGGTGGVTIAGTGVQTLTGANTYTGGTTITAGGALQLGNGGTSGSIAGNVVDNGALIVNQSGNVTIASVLSGAGSLTQAGSGQLTLTGTSTLSGPTTVSAGTLAVNGSLGQSTVTVQNGATVTGTGTIGGRGAGRRDGGRVAAGRGAERGRQRHVPAGSTFQVAASPQQSGSLAASGTATLNGGTVQVLANQSGYQPSTTYTILSAGSGVQGTFSQVNANYAFLAPTLSYDPDHVPAAGLERYRVSRCRDDAEPALGRGRARRAGAGNRVRRRGDDRCDDRTPRLRDARRRTAGEPEEHAAARQPLCARRGDGSCPPGLAPGSGLLAALSSGARPCGDNTAGAVDPTLPPERRIGSRDGCYGGTPYQPVVWGRRSAAAAGSPATATRRRSTAA